MELTNKQLRDQREFETLFKNPKHARAMWAQNVIDRYAKPALRPIMIYDKDGNPSPTSQIEMAVWQHLKQELEDAGIDRLPSEGEMMEACQQYYSRHNASSYVARRDSMGAKPIDETKQQVQVNNPLENLSDEELFVMQEALEKHRAAEAAKLSAPKETKDDK
jgi:hypothetical protein